MGPLTRRKPSSIPPLRLRLDELPNDVLILICGHCRIDELFTLRLVCSRLCNLISTFTTTIVPSVARSTFPLSNLLLQPLDDPAGYTLYWLKGLIPQHLAAILVDRHRFSNGCLTQVRYGIPSEDVFSLPLRNRVANGWRVLQHLSSISEEVYNLDARDVLKSTTNFAWRLVHPARYKFEVFRQREDMILGRRLRFINAIPDAMARDYKLMFMLLSSAFRTSISNYGEDHKPWIFDWSMGIDGQRLLRRGNSWLTWFVLHEGPRLFWQQWWFLSPEAPETKNHIRDRSIEAWLGKANMGPEDFIRQFLPREWNDVNEKWHEIQRDYAYKVQKAIEDKAATSSDFTSVNPILYFTQYAECRRLREASGEVIIPEVLEHVPFHVDFRCPEELFQKFCMLREEKAMALSVQPSARA